MATAKYKRGKDGYFSTNVWDGTYTAAGKKHQKHLRSKKSSKDLERKVKEFEDNVKKRKSVKTTDTTFLEYARMWKDVYKGQREDATKEMYANIIEKHFSALETIRLQDIDRIHLQMLLNNAEGKSRTQQQIYMVFKQVLKSAVADRLYSANVYEDLFKNIEPIKYRPKEKRPLTEYEREAVFKADFKEQDKIYVYIVFGCGLRREEALALTIFDVSLKQKTVSVSNAHSLVYGNPKEKEPKSDNGYRTIPIPSSVFPDVERYIQKLKSEGKTYLFTMRNGKPMTKSSYDKMWARIIKRMQEVSDEEITGLTSHIFRHNFCTNLCYQIPKISIQRIAQLMGDTEAMVLNVYNHIMMEKEDAEAAVNDAMGR
nr:site-specific integrase [uncultured Anaerostipes sp.]